MWRDVVRPEQLRRRPDCEQCTSEGELSLATQVDHRTPLEEGGEPFKYDNLQSLCFRCHTIKTAAENRARAKLKKYASRKT